MRPLILIVEDEPAQAEMLPQISGLEVCRLIRAKDRTRHLPVIMVTARSEEDDKLRGFHNGADDYVVKPFSPIEMTARVRVHTAGAARPCLLPRHVAQQGVRAPT